MTDPRRTRAVVAGCAVSIGGAWNMTNIGPVAEQLTSVYAASLVTIGAFTTVLFLFHSFSQIPGGHVVDRTGPRPIALLAVGLTVGAGLAAMIAPSTGLALGCRAVAGVATGLSFVSGTDFVRRFGGTSFDQGVFGGVGLASGGLALAVVPALEDLVGWRAPYLSAAAIGLCVLPFVLMGPKWPHHERPPRPAVRPVVLRNPELLRFGVIHATGLGFTVVIGNWVVTLLTRHGVDSLFAAGVIGSLVLATGAIGRPLGGWIARRSPEHTHALVAGSMVMGGVATAVLASGAPVPVLVLATAVVGIAGGLPFGPALFGAGRVIPESGGAAAGVVNTFSGIAIIIGIPLMALTFGLPGDGQIGFFAAAVIWAAMALVVPASAAFRLPARPLSAARGQQP